MRMVHYPDCPYCGNTSLSIVDVEINGASLKGIQCNNPECSKYIGFYRDYDTKLDELTSLIDDLEDKMEYLEK